MSGLTEQSTVIAQATSLTHLPWLSPSGGTARPCIRDACESLTYIDVERRAAAFADHLSRLGIGRNDTIAVMLPNSVPLLIAMLGAWRVGAAVTPINPTFTARELSYQLEDSGARLVVADELPESLRGDSEDGRPLHVRPGEMQQVVSVPPAHTLVSPDRIALVVYTSGSTGQPKGVLLDHVNLSAMASSLSAHLELSPTDQALLVLPLFHVNSLCVSFLAPISAGGSVTLLERFSPDQFVQAIGQYEPTFFSAVPAIFARLMELPPEATIFSASLRFAICGAAPATAELLQASEQRLGIPILEGYGLTEATCASACNPLRGARKPGTVGPALPGQRIGIIDADGERVPTGVTGEVIIAGPTVMRGYLGRPDASAEAFHDGWVRTGDVGFLDEDGYLTLVDRIKDMIIRGGENLYPKEIEAFLATHPDVLESAVVGRPDPVYGEVPIAHVVLAPGAATTSDELRDHCRLGLTKVKVPAEIHIVDALLRNPVGKVDKPAMRRAVLTAA